MKICLTLLLSVLLFSCIKEELQKQAVLNAMTGGQWKVVRFKKGSTDVTTDFTTYTFQFKENQTVDAIHNSTIENTGTWTADAEAKTITSFFSNATTTLSLLNGTWLITNNSWTFVEASQSVNGEARILRLEKL